MISTIKLLEYFDASKIQQPIHIVGCGAVGSHIVEQLVRMGCTNLHLWDFDTVEAHNISNQMFTAPQIGMLKTDAVAAMANAINPGIKLTLHSEGSKPPYNLYGHVFLCVDNIELRAAIVKANRYNVNVKSFFDFRMRLTDGQCYFADRSNKDQMNNLLASMDFTHEEAKVATPQSACGVELSVIYTVKAMTAVGIHNFVTFILTGEAKPVLIVDMKELLIAQI